jgi:hypothetical protein
MSDLFVSVYSGLKGREVHETFKGGVAYKSWEMSAIYSILVFSSSTGIEIRFWARSRDVADTETAEFRVSNNRVCCHARQTVPTEALCLWAKFQHCKYIILVCSSQDWEGRAI